MKKAQQLLITLTIIFIQLIPDKAICQCNWRTQLFDGFEYTTACPYVIPGTVYTSIPQTHSVHSGTQSLYLNFVNCAGGTGTCAGDTVFNRTIAACPGNNLRISSYLTTTFAGGQCDMRLLILDANDNVLVNTASLLAPYSPAWILYQSGSFNPTTSTIKFVMITNADGGNGNDLSMDDFLVEQCYPIIFGNDTTICNTQAVTLNAGSGYASYLWNDGSTNQTLIASTTNTGGASTSFYNCQVTDSSGCTFRDTIKVTFLVCSGINELNNNNPVSVYPNPVHDLLTVVYVNKPAMHSFFSLMDLMGRELKKVELVEESQIIHLEDNSSGIYFYTITSDDRIIKHGKIEAK